MSSMFGSIAKSNVKMKNTPPLSHSPSNRHSKSHSIMNKTINTFQSPTKKNNNSPNASGPNSDVNFAHSMKKIREKLSNTLDAHYLVLQTGAPIRCLQHNSVISLYCETQQKLLCANCVYRSVTHKLHKVLPVEKCYKSFARDIDLVERQCERQIAWLQQTQKTIQDHFKEEQKTAQQILFDLASSFDQIRVELDRSFEEIRKKIFLSLDNLCFKQETVLLQLGFFKEIFKRNKLPKQQQIPKLDERILLYHHSIAMTLLEFGKVEGKKLNPGKSKIRTIYQEEQKKLSKILQTIKELGRSEYKQQKN